MRPLPEAALSTGAAARAASTAAALRKRPWDPSFLDSLDRAAAGDPIRFELVNGETARGAVRQAQRDGRSLICVSGELTAPERGRFFFQKQTRPGRAGDYAGVVEFPAAGRAYRIEPSGPGGSPELVERPLGEVLCQKLPRPRARSTHHAEETPPLNPANFPSLPIPPYQNGIVSLESLHGATVVLYMDFQGGYTPAWGGISYAAAGLSNDQIRALWQQVAGDFMPFDVNVTTDLSAFQNAPQGSRQRVIITPTDTAMADAGGVAYIGSFNWTGDTPCWVFVTEMEYCAQACSHELGHTLGLSHDGQQVGGTHVEYFEGQGDGAVGWVPIMGVPYYKNVIQWCKGEYPFANNPEDQLAMISSLNNNVAYRTDTTGGTPSNSRPLETYADGTAGAEGLIEYSGAANAFSFTTGGGPVSLRADPQNAAGPLALNVVLLGTNSAVLAQSNPQDTLWAAVSNTLPAGAYTLYVIAAGRNDPMTNGFSPYASLGQTAVPGWLTNVVAIAAGADYSLALSGQGTVTAWGDNRHGQANVPTYLANVVAIAAGDLHCLALLGDGTVTAWGDNSHGQTSVPAGLSNVVSIAAGGLHSLALKADGSIVGWGAGSVNSGLYPDLGQAMAPANQTPMAAVSAGTAHSLALVGWGAPSITQPPVGLTVYRGTRAAFRAAASGALPLSYQWQLNGTNLPGATSQVLILPEAGQAGDCRVVVSNAVGVVVSAAATLTLVDQPPYLLVQPQGQTGYLGGQVNLQVLAGGSGPLTYQWYTAGASIPGATNTTLTLSGLSANQSENYYVVVSNPLGTATSAVASLSSAQMLAWGAGADRSGNPNFGQSMVPAGLSGVVRVAGGGFHSLALKADGTVVAWGAGATVDADPDFGQSIVPAGLRNVVAIAAGGYHSLALKADGTIAAWGLGQYGETNVPVGLNNVVAIAAGDYHSIALKGDGSVVVWGGASAVNIVPSTATGLIAIASAGANIIGIRSDGTLVRWGETNAVPLGSRFVGVAAGSGGCLALKNTGVLLSLDSDDLPSGMPPVSAMAAGFLHNLALKPDGTVLSWGLLAASLGMAEVPAGLTNVIDIACGDYHNLAAVAAPVATIQSPPPDRAAELGGTTLFSVVASGAQPLSYLWQLNGTNLPGATGQRLTLSGLQPANAGGYRVVVTNSFGMATSRVAQLVVLPSLAQALNTTGLVWSTAGDAGWWVETNVTHDGVAAAQSAHINTGQQSSIWTYVTGPGALRFWWKVSSEKGYDYLVFASDGTVETSVSGEVDWQLLSYSVPAGAHSLQWVFAKTSSGAAGGGQDTAWLDQVSFIPDRPVITLQPVGQTVSMGADLVLTVAASGISPMSYQWLRNGVSLPGATSTSLVLTNANRRTSGSYWADASNPAGFASSSNALVYVRVPQKLTSPSIGGGGTFTLLSGDADGGALLPSDLSAFRALASINFKTWTVLGIGLSITNGLLQFVDPASTNYERRFYRIEEIPAP
ncbi:MAG: immunoglobulin domain-containing protein [Limisphaerales bacterium]